MPSKWRQSSTSNARQLSEICGPTYPISAKSTIYRHALSRAKSTKYPHSTKPGGRRWEEPTKRIKKHIVMKALGRADQADQEAYRHAISDPTGFFLCVAEAHDLLDQIDANLTNIDATLHTTDSGANSNAADSPVASPAPARTTSTTNASTNLRLPQLELLHFRGDPLLWPMFWASFQHSVDEAPIPTVHKLSYLLGTLEGEAARTVAGYAFDENNYSVIKEALIQRYGNLSALRRALHSQLQALKPAERNSFNENANTILTIVRQLKEMGDQINNPLLETIIESKLPNSILMEIYKEKERNPDWNVESLCSHLQTALRIQEQLKWSQDRSIKRKSDETTPTKEKVEESSAFTSVQKRQPQTSPNRKGRQQCRPHSKEPPPCPFCNAHHWAALCNRFQDTEARMNRAKKLKLCLRCLRKGHFAESCPSRRPCYYCRSTNHHQALCTSKTKRTEFKDSSVVNVAEENSQPTTDSVQANHATLDRKLCTQNTSNDNERVLLLTATAQVSNPRSCLQSKAITVLFDTGSDRTFITAELAHQLSLPTIANKRLAINGFGATPVQTFSTNVVQLLLNSQQQKPIPITAHVVPKLTQPLTTVQLPANVPLQQGIVQLCTRAEAPSLLIGIDQFSELVDLSSAQKLPSELNPNSAALRERWKIEDRQKETNTKILGIPWNVETDKISFIFKQFESSDITKRTLLSWVASIFDPLGYLTPATLPIKVFIQSLWRMEYGWDEALKEAEFQRASALIQGWHRQPIIIKRQIGQPKFLHCFVDSSKTAYASAIFTTSAEGSSLIMSKNRLAPIKGMTIARLELLAILIGSRLLDYVSKQMNLNIPLYLWSDSQIALSWVITNSERDRFVRNQVQKIRAVKNVQFRFVPGDLNPADLATRGLKPEELVDDLRWWQGPSFISKAADNWPDQTGIPTDSNVTSGVTVIDSNVCGILEMQYPPQQVFNAKRFSNWNRLLRTAATVLRFLRKMKEYCPAINNRDRLLDAWSESNRFVERFWKVWETEYLLALRERSQRQHRAPSLSEVHWMDNNFVVVFNDPRVSGDFSNG
uniref:CCHC-type domain-containing protein n=1 Tax=Ascaris lumbricoides TaxID=6252 RepID=A0A0M3I1S5_ASCLU